MAALRGRAGARPRRVAARADEPVAAEDRTSAESCASANAPRRGRRARAAPPAAESVLALGRATPSLRAAHGSRGAARWPTTLELERDPSLRHGPLTHVVLVDPPPFAHLAQLASRAASGGRATCTVPGARPSGASRSARSASSWPSGRRSSPLYRDLREAGAASGEDLREALLGSGPHPRRPETAARCFRVLAELGLVRGAPDGGAGEVGVVSSEGTDLERSASFAPTAPAIRRASDSSKDRDSRSEPGAPARDLFAVVEEFDSAAGRERRDGAGNGGHRASGATRRRRLATIDREAIDPRLRLRLRSPRRPAAALRRRVHHPPRRGRPDLRRDAARHRDPLRRPAARHGRGHQRQPRGDRVGVRRRDRPARRRRHQADRDHLREPRRAPGRELPEDDGGDGHRRPGDPDQARRPPPQHAHARRAAEAEADRRRRARRWRSTRRWPTGWGSTRSSGSWRTSPSPTLHPRKYDEIKQLVAQQRDERESYVEDAGSFLAGELRRSGSRRRSPAAPSTSTRSTRR